MYRVTNNIMARKLPPMLPENSASHADLGEHFLVYFFDKFAKIRCSLNYYDVPAPLLRIDNNHEHCILSAFTSMTVTAIIRLVNKCPRKSCSLDPLLRALLKTNINIITPTLASIINLSLVSVTVPSDMKHALATPLLKKTGLDANDIKNYCPISNLSFALKLLERHVTATLTKTNILSAYEQVLYPDIRRYTNTSYYY